MRPSKCRLGVLHIAENRLLLSKVWECGTVLMRGGIEQCDGNSWYPTKAISCAFHAYSSGIYSLHFAYNDWEPHFAVVHSDESPLEIANQLNAMTVARLDYLNGGPPSLHTYSEEDERAQYNGTTGGACKCGPGAV